MYMLRTHAFKGETWAIISVILIFNRSYLFIIIFWDFVVKCNFNRRKKARFGTRKVQEKKKIFKKNDFLIFDFTIGYIKENHI